MALAHSFRRARNILLPQSRHQFHGRLVDRLPYVHRYNRIWYMPVSLVKEYSDCDTYEIPS